MSRLILRCVVALVVVAGAVVVVTHLAACNTVKGVGTDIHNVGQAGSNAINRSGSSSSTSTPSQSE